MAESPKRPGRITPKTGWALPLAYWQDSVARARERAAGLAPSVADAGHAPDDDEALHELLLSLEELQVAEAELHAQNEELQDTRSLIETERVRYAALFARAPAPFIVTDASGTIRQANAAAAALLGCRVERLARKPLAVFTRDASRQRLRSAISAMRDRDALTVRVNLTTRRHTVVRAEVSIVAIRDLDGDASELLWLFVDETKRLRREARRRREAERLEQLVAERTAQLEHAQELKNLLIATVSHEFRTALSAIGGYAELLETGVRGPLTAVQAADVRRIQRASLHLARLVDDLLNYSRLTRGKLELSSSDIVVGELLRAARELIAPQARERSITVATSATPIGLMVRADAERVRQIVVNLLANAVKFAKIGGAVWAESSATETEVIIEVRDEGPGIPADKLEKIFEPFVRLPSATPTTGSGLGLAISRDLARAMQGDLTVTSEIGIGSRFVLRLPRNTQSTHGAATG